MTHEQATEEFFEKCLGWDFDCDCVCWRDMAGHCVTDHRPEITTDFTAFKQWVIPYARERGYSYKIVEPLVKTGDFITWFTWASYAERKGAFHAEIKDDDWLLAGVEAALKIPREGDK